MTDDEALAFIAEGRRTAMIATTMADGGPHAVPVWFTLDGREIVFSCARSSVKGRNLARDPRVAVCVDDETFPYAFAVVRGPVEILPRPDDFLSWTTRIAERYVGPERADHYGRQNEVLDDLLVRVTPARIFAQADIAL